MKLSRAAIAVYMGLVFASGALLGAFAHRLYTVSGVRAEVPTPKPTPSEVRTRYLDEMKTRLKLNDEQMTKLSLIFDDGRARIRETGRKTDLEFQTIREEQQQRIRALLSPEQQTEYEKLRKERQHRSKGGGGKMPGPGF